MPENMTWHWYEAAEDHWKLGMKDSYSSALDLVITMQARDSFW